MRLTDEQITKYQQIYLDTYGNSISKDDALVQGLALIELVKVLSVEDQPTKENEDDDKIPTAER